MYDELIEQMRSRASWLEFAIISTPSKTNGNGDAILFRKAADAIADLITALTASNEVIAKIKPKWIPVTERLPKENGFYLCLYKHKAPGGIAMDEGLSILQWINNKWGINDIYLVTHWMPLPQPPESADE